MWISYEVAEVTDAAANESVQNACNEMKSAHCRHPINESEKESVENVGLEQTLRLSRIFRLAKFRCNCFMNVMPFE